MLWTGPGCSEATGYHPVGKTAAGVVQWERIDEVSVVDKGASPGAEVLITKRAGSAPEEKEVEVTSISEAITKALVPDASDTDREATDKALVRKQLETGALKADQFGAELALESHAATLRKSNPDLSAEQAFVKAMDQHPDLARLALG